MSVQEVVEDRDVIDVEHSELVAHLRSDETDLFRARCRAWAIMLREAVESVNAEAT